MTHTPGLWKVTNEAEGTWVYADPSQNVICDIVGRDDPAVMTDEDIANANLIATAPELLLALENALEMLEAIGKADVRSYAPLTIGICKTAIAKAKGAQS